MGAISQIVSRVAGSRGAGAAGRGRAGTGGLGTRGMRAGGTGRSAKDEAIGRGVRGLLRRAR